MIKMRPKSVRLPPRPFIIYATTYGKGPGRPIKGKSTDSGFKSIDQVVEAMGNEYTQKNKRMVVYDADNEHNVVFSDFPFSFYDGE